MLNIEAITMDLDDTLWDCHPVINKAEERLWNWLKTNYPKIIGFIDQFWSPAHTLFLTL